MPDVPPPKPGDALGRLLDRLRANRLGRGGNVPSSLEEALAKGVEGERRLGGAVNQAADSRGGCWVLHGLVLPGRRADIDHVVIGPAGVTAIDAKAWVGKVWLGRVGLGRGRKAFPREIDGMSRQINRVHSELAKAGRDDVPVTGVVCFVNDNEGIPRYGLAEIRGVKVGRVKATINHALRDGPLDSTTIEIVHRILAGAFTVHGGSQAPTARSTQMAIRPGVSRIRSTKVLRGTHKVALALLTAMIALAAVAALVGALDASVDRAGKAFGAYSRDDLRADRAELRKVAVKRAHGRVRGPSVRAEIGSFVLTYRRGRHCRVVVKVSRAAPAWGGGRHTDTSSGCTRRR